MEIGLEPSTVHILITTDGPQHCQLLARACTTLQTITSSCCGPLFSSHSCIIFTARDYAVLSLVYSIRCCWRACFSSDHTASMGEEEGILGSLFGCCCGPSGMGEELYK
jgi:hypothetical protein